MSTSGGSSGGTNLAPTGTYIAEIAAWGEPGFVDPAAGNDSAGWLALFADPTQGDVTVGFGSDGLHFAEMRAVNVQAVFDAGADNGSQATITVHDAYVQQNMRVPTAQALPVVTVRDQLGNHMLAMTPKGAFDFLEQADPAAPAANVGRLYARDDGGGKTQIVARFPTGAVQVIATEP